MMTSKGKSKSNLFGLKLDNETLKKFHQKYEGALDFSYYV